MLNIYLLFHGFLQLPFWNGCDEDDHCVPDLVLQSQTDLMNRK